MPRLAYLLLVLALCLLALVLSSVAGAKGVDLSGLNKEQRQVVEHRLSQGPGLARVLLGRIGENLSIRPARDEVLGGGYYSETGFGSKGTEYTVWIHKRSLRRSSARPAWDRHMLWHELGHVLVNAYSTPSIQSRAFSLFAGSARWQDCFFDPTSIESEACVPEEEIFADQLAFWATGEHRVRSPRKVPPLATRKEVRWEAIDPMISRRPR